MWPELIAGTIAHASLVAGYEQNKKNQRNQEWQNFRDRVEQEKMAAWQAIQAKRDFDTANKYNSPLEQMNRLRQAGLNPMLVYGKGAENTAQMARGVQPSTPNQEAPKVDNRFVGSSLSSFLTSLQVQAQTDNLDKQGDLMTKEGLLKDAQTAKTMQETATSKFELEKAMGMKDMVYENARLNNEYLRQKIGIEFDRNEREEIANSSNVALTLQRIVTEKLTQGKTVNESNRIKQDIDNMKLEAQLKQLDIDLKKKGIMPHDPLYSRLIARFLDNLGLSGVKEEYYKKYGSQHMDSTDIVP